VFFVKLPDEAGEDGGAYGLDGADGQSAGQLRGFRDSRPGAGELLHDGGRMAVKHLALVGQDRLFSDPVEKVDA